MTINKNSKYLFKTPEADAKMRLFFFPYGGGGASIGMPFRELLSPQIDVIPIQLPARENRIKEPALTSMSQLIDQLMLCIECYLDVPIILWGHCSGAIISFELARAIRKLHGIEPACIISSACTAPQLVAEDTVNGWHLLPDREFLSKIEEIMGDAFNGSSNKHLLQILLSGLKADFAIYENYTYIPEPTFSCPIITFGGSADKRVDQKSILQWQQQTTGKFVNHMYENAHHFFISNPSANMAQSMKEIIFNNILERCQAVC